MGLHIYRKSLRMNNRGGRIFRYIGEFGPPRNGIIPDILQSDEVAQALGTGKHELIVGFRPPLGALPSDGPLQWLTHEFVTVDLAPPVRQPLRVTSVEALI